MEQRSLHNQLIREIKREVEKCAMCGACQSVCPIFKVTGRESGVARGKISVAGAFLSGTLEPSKLLYRIADNCLLCLACKENCPNGVDVEKVIRNLRILLNEVGLESLDKKLAFRYLLRNRKLFENSVYLEKILEISKLESFLPPDAGLRVRYPFSLLFEERLFPELPPLRERIPPAFDGLRSRGRALFFVGCSIQYFRPRIGLSVVEILRQLGYSVIIPEDQGCCGHVASVSGDAETALHLSVKVRDMIEALSPDLIVTACPTCNRQLQDILSESSKTVPVLDIGCLLKEFTWLQGPRRVLSDISSHVVTFHDPCHLARGLGIRKEPREILRFFFGTCFREIQDSDKCCGMGGLYGIIYPEVSLDILRAKMKTIKNVGATLVFTSCPACVLQLELGAKRENLPVKVLHLAQLIEFITQS